MMYSPASFITVIILFSELCPRYRKHRTTALRRPRVSAAIQIREHLRSQALGTGGSASPPSKDPHL